MSRNSMIVVGLVVWVGLALAAAQTTGAQASGSASNQSSVSADRSGANVASQSSADASASASREGKQSGKAAANGSNSSYAAVGKGNADLSGGSTINAVLSKPLDAKKNKSGDPVTAKVTDDVKSSASGSSQVVIPKGSRLVGHVTEARPRDKNEQKAEKHAARNKGQAAVTGQGDSTLGIVFDRAILKNGREVPVHAVIQAVGASQQSLTANTSQLSAMDNGSAMASGGGMTGGGGGGGLLGGGGVVGSAGSTLGTTTSAVGNTAGGLGSGVGGTVNSTTNAAGSVGGVAQGATTATGRLTSSANGVVGLQGLNLTSAAAGTAQASSRITSSTRDVHLDSGTQMLLRVTGSAK